MYPAFRTTELKRYNGTLVRKRMRQVLRRALVLRVGVQGRRADYGDATPDGLARAIVRYRPRGKDQP